MLYSPGFQAQQREPLLGVAQTRSRGCFLAGFPLSVFSLALQVAAVAVSLSSLPCLLFGRGECEEGEGAKADNYLLPSLSSLPEAAAAQPRVCTSPGAGILTWNVEKAGGETAEQQTTSKKKGGGKKCKMKKVTCSRKLPLPEPWCPKIPYPEENTSTVVAREENFTP